MLFFYAIKKEGGTMANKSPTIENLTPFTEMSEERAREIRSMGGKASGESRKRKKAMREQAELLLSLPLKDKKAQKVLQGLGLKKGDLDNQMIIVAAMWQRAAKGDIEAATWLRDLLGEKPAEQLVMSGELNNPFKDLTTEELRELIKGE